MLDKFMDEAAVAVLQSRINRAVRDTGMCPECGRNLHGAVGCYDCERERE